MKRRTFTLAASSFGFLASLAGAQETETEAPEITEMVLGPEDAKVTVVEYASFTCPHCAAFHQNQYKDLKADYIDTGKIRFIYRDVYFDRVGLWAAMVARCGGPEKFFGISDMIYNDQNAVVRGESGAEIADNLRRVGKIAGLDDAQLDQCMSDEPKAKALVAWYEKNKTEDNVSSTPTLIINGVQYGNMPYSQLKGIIDKELAS